MTLRFLAVQLFAAIAHLPAISFHLARPRE
jgi:hypothetical protein